MNAERQPVPLPLITPAEQGVCLTEAGVKALIEAHCPSECDLCRRELQTGDAYHRVTLGMDEAPSHVGALPLAESTVEELSEIIVCQNCAPAVAAPLDRLLELIWSLRQPDPRLEHSDPQPETERSQGASS